MYGTTVNIPVTLHKKKLKRYSVPQQDCKVSGT